MKILPYVLLKERYDVIVVRAGLGGMAAANLLAKRGLSVLLDRPAEQARRRPLEAGLGPADRRSNELFVPISLMLRIMHGKVP